jgi:GNAT superfamily N-acetyltransferase
MFMPMRIELEIAGMGDAAAIAALRLATARQLTERYGHGAWSATNASTGGVEMETRTGELFLARAEGSVVATLRLSSKNPWIGEDDFFPPKKNPLYLTSMAVHPAAQRQGIGRACVEAVKRSARSRGVGAIRLDAFDAPAGAGEFYRKCGFREIRRAVYFDAPLIWFEYAMK